MTGTALAGGAQQMNVVLFPILLSILLVPALATDAAAANKVTGKPCLAKYKSIAAKGKRWTAFAANRANQAGQACGWAIEFPARETAITGALSECKASERDHPTWGKHNTCSIVFVK
jgi:hypothetical protein